MLFAVDFGTKVSEVYDEIVFTEPHEAFYEKLKAPKAPPPPPTARNEHFTTFDDAPEVDTLLRAGEYVKGQLHAVKDAIARLDHQIGLARQLEQSRLAQEHAAAQQAAAAQQEKARRAQQQR